MNVPHPNPTSPTSSRPPAWLARSWDWLTRPSRQIADPGEHIQAQLLSAMLLALIAVGVFISILPISLNPAPTVGQIQVAQLGLGTAAVLGLIYGLARTRYYKLGALLAVLLLIAAAFAGSLLSQDPNAIGLLLYLTVPALLSCLFFSLRTTVLLVAAMLGAILAAPWLLPSADLLDVLDGPFAFVLINASLFILVLRYRTRMEQERRSALAESERRYRDLIECSPEMIAILAEGRFIYVNPAGLSLLGAREAAEVVGRPVLDFIHLDDQPLIRERLVSRDTERTEVRVLRLDGQVVETEGSGVSIRYGGMDARQIVVHNVTQRRAAERAMQRYAARLRLVHEIDQAILAAQSPDEIAEAALKELQQLVPTLRASVALFDYEAGEVEVLAALGAGSTSLGGGARFPLRELREATTLQAGGSLVVKDLDEQPDLDLTESRLLSQGIHGVVMLPLRCRGKLIGALSLGAAQPDAVDHQDIEILYEIADQLAVAIDDARLYDQLKRHSEHLETLVSERTAELQRITERTEAILHNSPDAILLLTPDGHIEAANQTFGALFGLQIEQVAHQPLASLLDLAETAALERMLKAIRAAGESRRFETIARTRSGRSFDAEIGLAAIREGEQLTGIVCSLRDVSALKEVQRMKDAFVSNVSHELRTPITSLKLYHQLIERQPDRLPTYIASLHRETERLEHIVEDLLLLSRLEQQQTLHTAPVDLNALARQYAADRLPLARELNRSLSITAEPDLPAVEGDPSLLGQVISILLTNALTYTPAGGSVRIETHQHCNGSGAWIGLTVRDSGPGIPPDEREQVFERFYRGAASRAVNSPGTGLGLAIAREIAARHQARLVIGDPLVQPDPDYPGAIFTLWLPVTDPGALLPGS